MGINMTKEKRILSLSVPALIMGILASILVGVEKVQIIVKFVEFIMIATFFIGIIYDIGVLYSFKTNEEQIEGLIAAVFLSMGGFIIGGILGFFPSLILSSIL